MLVKDLLLFNMLIVALTNMHLQALDNSLFKSNVIFKVAACSFSNVLVKCSCSVYHKLTEVLFVHVLIIKLTEINFT